MVCLRDVTFCHILTHEVRVSSGLKSSTLHAVAHFFWTKSYQTLISKDFLHPFWKQPGNAFHAPQLRKENCKGINVDGIVPSPIRIAALLLLVWLGTAENLAIARTAQSVVHRPRHSQRHLQQWENSPLAIDVSGTHCHEGCDKFDIRLYYSFNCVYDHTPRRVEP